MLGNAPGIRIFMMNPAVVMSVICVMLVQLSLPGFARASSTNSFSVDGPDAGTAMATTVTVTRAAGTSSSLS